MIFSSGGSSASAGLVQRLHRHALCIRRPDDLICLGRRYHGKAEVIEDTLENPEYLIFCKASRREHGNPALDDSLVIDEILSHDVAHKPDQVAQLYIIELHLDETGLRGRRSLAAHGRARCILGGGARRRRGASAAAPPAAPWGAAAGFPGAGALRLHHYPCRQSREDGDVARFGPEGRS